MLYSLHGCNQVNTININAYQYHIHKIKFNYLFLNHHFQNDYHFLNL
jgi:hypothetical protein